MLNLNNPGNIEASSTIWKGEIKPSTHKRFAQFQSMEYGIRAMYKILQTYRKYLCTSIWSIINRWAPPNENNTLAYVEFVEVRSGIRRDKMITTDEEYTRIIYAMILMENGIKLVDAIGDKAYWYNLITKSIKL